MHFAPLQKNPLETRADVAAALLTLWQPLRSHFAREGAAVSLGDNEAHYGQPHRLTEAFARPLWGIAALSAGGISFGDWELFRRGFAEGTDPEHPRYWGAPGNVDQRLVEMAALATGLMLAQKDLWDPLPPGAKANTFKWLAFINDRRLADNNWLFFRILVNTAFARLGGPVDEAAVQADQRRIEEFYQGDGWYRDGISGNRDYYGPMALHYYALLYGQFNGGGDPLYTLRYAERARLFGPHYAAWFARSGAALPFGRSLTYRFAQGSFWGACAFAGIPALPWGQMKHLYLQHLRWWLSQPVFTESGLLSVGYRYPNLIVADQYNAPGSPYWAFKAFVPLALPASHPFWMAAEEPLRDQRPVSPQPHARQVLVRDDARDHVYSLSGHSAPDWDPRFKKEKYSKFAYSTAFAFGVPIGGSAPSAGGSDSTLLLTDDEVDWRPRGAIEETRFEGETVLTRWKPWPDVTVETWLVPVLPGHLRIHRLKTPRPLRSFEGGFGTDCVRQKGAAARPGWAELPFAQSYSGIADLAQKRAGENVFPQPNTNLNHSLVAIPGLRGEHPAGEHWFATAVVGLPGPDNSAAGREFLAAFKLEDETCGLRVLHAGRVVFAASPPREAKT